MTLDELLAEARARDITLWAEGDRLRCSAPAGALTPEMQAELSRNKQEILARLRASDAAGAAGPRIERALRDGPLPLSFGQERLWFVQQMDPKSAAYNIFTVLPLTRVAVPILERTISEVVRRHELLRTTFPIVNGQPAQVIHPAVPVALTIHDLRALEPGARASEGQRLRYADARRPFDLAAAPPVRFSLLQLTDEDAELAITQHHIVTDGWSLSVLLEELAAVYAALAAGLPSPLPEPGIQYADFAVWQRRALSGEVLDRELAYWKRQLASLPVLDLPTDAPRPVTQTFNGASQALRLDQRTADGVKALSRREGVTDFMTLLAALNILLARYTGQDDIVVGTSNGNRERVELERMLGFFVQTQVMRTNVSGNPTVRELLQRVRAVAVDAYAHQDVPFEMLVKELRPARDLSRSPFFDVQFIMQNTPLQSLIRSAAGAATSDGAPTLFESTVVRTDAGDRVVFRSGTTQFDLTISVADRGNGFGGTVEYNTDLFSHETVARMLGHFERIVAAMVSDPSKRIRALEFMADAERRRFDAWNATGRPVDDGCVHELFERQAEATPRTTAVVDDRGALTYESLNERANRLAHYLRRLGAGGALVGVCLGRTSALPAAVLAVAKSGGAYVPLDPAYPRERLEFMLRDAGARFVITEERLLPVLPLPEGARAICIDREADLIDREPASNPGIRTSSEALAYVMFTSGSTGKPKGVQVPHRALTNFLASMREEPGLAPGDVLLSVTPLTFDIAGLELYLPLIVGASVVIAGADTAGDGRRLAARITSAGATVMQATPATWRVLLDSGWKGEPRLKALCGGEALGRELAARLRPIVGSLWNLYGPTETTIWSTACRLDDDRVVIGRPIANTTVHVLDASMRRVPPGVRGELYIGGLGVARGYLARPDLTAERFVPDPFSSQAGARLYRTGDVVRQLHDGRLEYISRIDTQVKLRGFRIELGEIESVLGAYPGVRQAIALVREDTPGDQRLVAYVVPSGDAAADAGALRELVQRKLPQHMHPSAYVFLQSLPLTPNGKVDRAALPAPDRAAAPRLVRAPRSALERDIAAIWSDVLKVPGVGLDENFFDLGGHSLLLVQVQSRLADRGHDVAILDLFQHPTVGTLAAHLAGEGVATRFGDEAAARVAARREQGDAAIAIVGLAGRFPGSGDVDRFWQNLRAGQEGIRFFSDDELTSAGVPEGLLQHANYVKARGPLDGADLFDAALFGFTPREADLMDPQHRVFLECAWEALERAGYDPQRYPGLIGVFAGSSISAYFISALASGAGGPDSSGVDLLLNGDKDHLPTRVSYKLNLRGPSVNVQTACSTSLVAVHLACRSLLARECDMALAGGVSVGISQAGGYLFVEGGIMSPDGHCRAFDATSRGTVGGNGVGLVVLKRLADAVADGDHIHAVVRGTAINNDGSAKVGYTAPSIAGESRAIAMAQAVAGIAGDTITYVEAHGTGTSLGDPIEVKALTQVFREATEERQYCALASVKSNIGHLDAAAGVAGLIKTALALEHREIPPSLHFDTANPEIDFANSPFYVNTTLRPWGRPAPGVPRRAAVSSFGLGGTNAHAVLEEAPDEPESGPSREWQVLPVSARTEEALDTSCDRLAADLEAHPDRPLADVAFTLAVGRQQLDARRVVVARSSADAAVLLRREGSGNAAHGRRRDAKVGFLFPGQGAQYARMGAGLYASERVYRDGFDACASLFQAAGVDVERMLYAPAADEGSDPLRTTVGAQAALFAVEYALARLWMSWGVLPAALAGHSLGEYVAAVLSGVLSLEDGVALVAERAKLMAAAPEGAMLAVATQPDRARELAGPAVSVAAVNAPGQCVLSGDRQALQSIATKLTEEQVESRWLQTAGAFHSALMDGVCAPLTALAGRLSRRPPQIPYVSNVTGTWISEADLSDAAYWARHARGTVEFHAGAQALLDSGCDVLIEMGPGQTLTGLVRSVAGARAKDLTFVTSLPRSSAAAADGEHVALALGRVWIAGAALDWNAYFAGERRRRIALPTYPFERRRHWFAAAAAPQRETQHQPTGKRADVGEWFYAPAWKSTLAVEQMHDREEDPSRVTIVFGDSSELTGTIVGRLRSEGATAWCVRPGRSFERVEDGEYRIDPARPEDFVALIRALGAPAPPVDVVHLWGAGLAPEWRALAPDARERGFYTTLSLVQALAPIRAVARLALVTRGAERVSGLEPQDPAQALVHGLARVAPQEYEQIACSTIDIDPAAEPEIAALADRICAELACGLPEAAIAYRAGTRWVRTFEPCPLKPRAVEALPVRDGDVYLITGGIGRVGLDFAERLASRAKIKLVLTKRSAFPERGDWAGVLEQRRDGRTIRHIQRLQRLEQRGAEVSIAVADVADEPAMRGVLEAAERRFGPLTGVIHAAGVLTPAALRPIAEIDRALCEGQFTSKVDGLQVLDRLLDGRELKFRLLVSSLSAVLGGLTYAAYASANAYMDAFADAARAPIWTSVAWDGWRAAGDDDQRVSLTARFGMTSQEGGDAFDRVIGLGPVRRLVVSTGDLPTRLAEWSGRARPSTAASAQTPRAMSEAGVEYAAPRNDVEQAIAAIWSDLFGIDRIGVHDDFFALGGHSLLATRLMSRVREMLQVDVPLEALFRAPTIAGVSDAVLERFLETSAGEDDWMDAGVEPAPGGAGPAFSDR